MKYGFGVDLGGTTVKIAYFDKNGKDKQEQDSKDKQNKQDPNQKQQKQQEKMSRDNAEQLLNAAMQNEQATQRRVKDAMRQNRSRKLDKNW